MLLLFGEIVVELAPDGQEGYWRSFSGGPLVRQALAAAATGARTRLLGRVGRDAFGRRVEEELAKSGVATVLQKDEDHPTSLMLGGERPAAYRLADTHLEPPGDAFFEGGTLIHGGAWIFGVDPARTTAVEVFHEGLRRGLALSLDLRLARWAVRGDLEEVLRPYLPLSYMKADAETAEAMGIRPGELFQWAGQVLYFDEGSVRRLSLLDEKQYRLPPNVGPDEVYGRFLAYVAGGAEATTALERALSINGKDDA